MHFCNGFISEYSDYFAIVLQKISFKYRFTKSKFEFKCKSVLLWYSKRLWKRGSAQKRLHRMNCLDWFESATIWNTDNFLLCSNLPLIKCSLSNDIISSLHKMKQIDLDALESIAFEAKEINRKWKLINVLVFLCRISIWYLRCADKSPEGQKPRDFVS